MARCNRADALQEHLVGALTAYHRFGGPFPTAAETVALFADAPSWEIPQGEQQARLCGFCWQYARSIDEARQGERT